MPGLQGVVGLGQLYPERQMKIHFINIVWDTDGDSGLDLPHDLVAEVPDDLDVENDGADFLSDKYDFLVESFSWEEAD